MGSARLSLKLRKILLANVHRGMGDGPYPNRSQAIQAAVREKMECLRKRRLAAQAAKLDPKEERALAEDGL